MAAPAEYTIKDLTGTLVLNKTLSDETDSVLALQGIGWWTRKAIGLATITLYAKQYTDDNGITHIDIEQSASGLKASPEYRTLDWTIRDHADNVFGNLKTQSRWVTLAEIDDPYLVKDWLEGDEEAGGPKGEKHVQSYVNNEEKGWTGNMIWGFVIIDGKRYYARKSTITKGKEVKNVRLVYNWVE